jgi:hypothetical protein
MFAPAQINDLHAPFGKAATLKHLIELEALVAMQRGGRPIP